MRLPEIKELQERLAACDGVTAWHPHCGDAKRAAFVAWNVAHDDWFEDEEVGRLKDAIAAHPDASGAPLLASIAASLQRVRELRSSEIEHVPEVAATHVTLGRLTQRFDLDEDSAWVLGALNADGVLSELPEGTELVLRPRSLGARSCVWVTFDTSRTGVVPRDPDEVYCNLGLAYQTDGSPVVRVELPLRELASKKGAAFIPTVFESLVNGPSTVWRARPRSEKMAAEPWGLTRHLVSGTGCLPELIADSTGAGRTRATVLGHISKDWSAHGYLVDGPR